MEIQDVSGRVMQLKSIPNSEVERINVDHLKNYIDKITDEDIEDVAHAVLNIANYIKHEKYDVVIFTGSSRLLLRSLFQNLDLGEAKIVWFDVHENDSIYKTDRNKLLSQSRDSDEHYQHRADNMTKILSSKGVNTKNAKIAVVDDHIANGYKARDYLEVMNKVEGLSDFRYIIPLAAAYDHYMDMLDGDLGRHFMIMSHSTKVVGLLALLSDALRVYDGTRIDRTRSKYSEATAVVFKNTVRDFIKILRNKIDLFRRNN